MLSVLTAITLIVCSAVLVLGLLIVLVEWLAAMDWFDTDEPLEENDD